MKKRIITIITLFCSFSCFSQNRIDEVAGTWMYQNNDTTFKIKLVKGVINYKNGEIREALLGGYFLQVADKIIDDYTDIPLEWNVANAAKPTEANVSILAMYNKKLSTIAAATNFYDRRKKHFNGDGIWGGEIKILPSGKLHWKLDEKWGIWARTESCEDCPPIKLVGFSVPEDVILTKIE